MDAPLIVRPATRTDLPRLLDLYLDLDPNDRLPSLDVASRRLEALHAYPGSTILVGMADDIAIAACTLVVIPNITREGRPFALIENVVTHRSYRRCGFGKQMLRAAVDAAWEAGCYKVMLMTGSKRPSTVAFYAAAGFEQSKTGFQIRRPSA